MKCCICFSSRKRYSLVTLKPTSKEERKLFWEFRCEDIVEMYDYKCFFTVALLLIFLLNYFDDLKAENMQYRLIRRLVNLALIAIVWLIARAKRFKHSFIYLMPVLLIATRFTAILAALAAVKSTDSHEEQFEIIMTEISSTVSCN